MAGLIATNSGGDFKLTEAGTHVARCVWVVDLGSQPNKNTNADGELTFTRKVFINWEVYVADEEPSLVGSAYTLSTYKESHLGKALASWRGRPFTPEEEKAFDVTQLINAPCMLTLVHNTVGSKTYCNVQSVAKLMKGLPVPEPKTAPLVFLFADPDWDIYDNFSDGMKKWIAKADEWSLILEGRNYQHPLDAPAEDDDMDVPF
jgi:prolyl oligopeptidase PreP (S9A serine peptidase family)